MSCGIVLVFRFSDPFSSLRWFNDLFGLCSALVVDPRDRLLIKISIVDLVVVMTKSLGILSEDGFKVKSFGKFNLPGLRVALNVFEVAFKVGVKNFGFRKKYGRKSAILNSVQIGVIKFNFVIRKVLKDFWCQRELRIWYGSRLWSMVDKVESKWLPIFLRDPSDSIIRLRFWNIFKERLEAAQSFKPPGINNLSNFIAKFKFGKDKKEFCYSNNSELTLVARSILVESVFWEHFCSEFGLIRIIKDHHIRFRRILFKGIGVELDRLFCIDIDQLNDSMHLISEFMLMYEVKSMVVEGLSGHLDKDYWKAEGFVALEFFNFVLSFYGY
jgi:hypothetical protein